MNSILFGNGYWAGKVKEKITGLTNLLLVVDSKTSEEKINKCLSLADIAFICCSTSSHYEIVKKCLNNNTQYIFCTKPFTGDYDKAKELFEIAEQKGVHIFIDNLFLFREEIINLRVKEPRMISFYWMKQESRENLFDSLLYHDLYLLLAWSKCDKWKVRTCNFKDDSLYLFMVNGCQSCAFRYNIGNSGEKKWILIDDCIINLSYPKNDPLKECITGMIEGRIDYDLSRKITLDTLNLIGSIKWQIN